MLISKGGSLEPTLMDVMSSRSVDILSHLWFDFIIQLNINTFQKRRKFSPKHNSITLHQKKFIKKMCLPALVWRCKGLHRFYSNTNRHDRPIWNFFPCFTIAKKKTKCCHVKNANDYARHNVLKSLFQKYMLYNLSKCSIFRIVNCHFGCCLNWTAVP